MTLQDKVVVMNGEHGYGGVGQWADPGAEAGVEAAMRRHGILPLDSTAPEKIDG